MYAVCHVPPAAGRSGQGNGWSYFLMSPLRVAVRYSVAVHCVHFGEMRRLVSLFFVICAAIVLQTGKETPCERLRL